MTWDDYSGTEIPDRPSRTHSTWFHFVKNRDYYSAIDRIRTPHVRGRPEPTSRGNRGGGHHEHMTPGGKESVRRAEWAGNPLGVIPGSVWEIGMSEEDLPIVVRHDTWARFRTVKEARLPNDDITAEQIMWQAIEDLRNRVDGLEASRMRNEDIADDLSYEEQYLFNESNPPIGGGTPPTLPMHEINDGITLIRADTRRIPLPDNSVDLVVTSPPYWAQRSYTDAGGQHYDGQIGDEPTPDMYVDNMIAATREWMRLVKPTGSIWVNLGDKYARTGGVGNDETPGWDNRERGGRRATKALGAPEKSLIGLPWRYALRCIDELGLILRQEVIWSKPNGMPESVTDRPRRSHEQWFFFTKEPRYYSAIDRVRDEYAPNTAHRYATSSYGPTKRGLAGATSSAAIISAAAGDGGPSEVNPLGKLPPSVWHIPTQGLTVPEELGVDHYAAFPMEWPRRIIQGWSPAEVCTVCGEGRRPVKTSVRNGGRIRQKADTRFLGKPKPDGSIPGGQDAPGAHAGYVTSHTIVGEACACTPYTDHPGVYVGVSARAGDALVPGNTPRSLGAEPQGPWREYHLDDWDPPPTRKAVVLDPFGGTGTTALVADVLGRNGVHVDMSADYMRIAEWRTTDPGQRASAMLVPRPSPPMPGQLDLFGGGNPYDMGNSYAEEQA